MKDDNRRRMFWATVLAVVLWAALMGEIYLVLNAPKFWPPAVDC